MIGKDQQVAVPTRGWWLCFYQLEKHRNACQWAIGGKEIFWQHMLWRRMSRKHGDPSSITEVIVCSALEVPTMWGFRKKAGFSEGVTPRICWGERQLTLEKWRRKSGRMTKVVQSVCGEVSPKWWRASTLVNLPQFDTTTLSYHPHVVPLSTMQPHGLPSTCKTNPHSQNEA